MPRKLKVFRTPIGFHDAYVAAPTQKAALEAWGTDSNLFARGTAEQVTDPKLTAAPLERPGEVICVSRGDLAAQLKALGPRKKKAAQTDKSPAKPVPAKREAPPRRDKVDAGEAALEEAARRHAEEAGKLEAERDRIERQLDALRAKQAKEIARLERTRDKARAAYREALEKWDD
jgi:hypothetical protein